MKRGKLSTAMKNQLTYHYKKSLDCVDSISLQLMGEAFKAGLERRESFKNNSKIKDNHREILDLIEEYLSQEGAEHLRFTQALYNLDIYKQVECGGNFFLEDNYNDLDSWVISRIKKVME